MNYELQIISYLCTMNRPYHLTILLILTMVFGCGQRHGHNANSLENAHQNNTNYWKNEASKQYEKLAYYYNNNIHDTLVMMAPEVLDFCREHELWTDYYETWTLLGQEYNFSGEYDNAIKVMQEMHDD